MMAFMHLFICGEDVWAWFSTDYTDDITWWGAISVFTACTVCQRRFRMLWASRGHAGGRGCVWSQMPRSMTHPKVLSCCGCKFYQLHGIVTLYMLWSSRSLCPLRFLQRHGQILWSDIRIKCKTCLHTPFHVHFAWSTRIESEGGCSPNYSFALSVYFANFLLGCCRPLSTKAKNGTHRSWPMTFSTGSFAQNLATWSHAGRCPISSCPSCWRAWPLRCRKLRNPSKSVWRYEIFRYLLISLRWWGTKRARWLDAVRTLLTPWFDVVTFRCSSVCKHQRGWVQYMWLLCTGKYMKHPKCI